MMLTRDNSATRLFFAKTMTRFILFVLMVTGLLGPVQATTITVQGKHQREDGSDYNFQVIDGDVLNPGDRFQVIIDAEQISYYAVIYIADTGQATQIFPVENQLGKIAAGQRQYIPAPGSSFTLDTGVGRELMFIVTANQAIRDMQGILQGVPVGNTAAIKTYLSQYFPVVEKLEIINTQRRVSGLVDQVASGLVNDLSRRYAESPWDASAVEEQDELDNRRRDADLIPFDVRKRAQEVRALLKPATDVAQSALGIVSDLPLAKTQQQLAQEQQRLEQEQARQLAEQQRLEQEREERARQQEMELAQQQLAQEQQRLEQEQARQLAEQQRLEQEREERARQQEMELAQQQLAQEQQRLEQEQARQLAEQQRLEQEREERARQQEMELAQQQLAQEQQRLEQEQARQLAEQQRLEQERARQQEMELAQQQLAQEQQRLEQEQARQLAEQQRLEQEREERARHQEMELAQQQLAQEQQRLEQEQARQLAEQQRLEQEREERARQQEMELAQQREEQYSLEEERRILQEAVTARLEVEKTTPQPAQEPIPARATGEVRDRPGNQQAPRQAVANLQAGAAPTSQLVTPPVGENLRRLYAAVASAIVSVHTAATASEAGFVLDEQGHVLTTWHAVHNQPKIEVKFIAIAGPSRTYQAHVVKQDRRKDLALLKLIGAPTGIQPIKILSADLPQVGESVRVFGHRNGQIWATDNGVITRIAEHFTWFSKSNSIHRGEILQIDLPQQGKEVGSLITNMSYQLLGIGSFFGRETGRVYAVSARMIKEFLADR